MKATVAVKRVSIVVDRDVEHEVLQAIHEFGASGYTRYEVQGAGVNGVRPRREVSPNVKIEVLATEEVARQILECVAERYFAKYAAIGYLEDVEVLRDAKFLKAMRENSRITFPGK